MTEPRIQLDRLQTLLDDHGDAFDRLAALLIDENQKYNLTRITDPRQIRIRHFLDALTAVPLLDAIAADLGRPLRIIDIGSGAGLPSLALAIVRPDWSFCSLEATGKKVYFQQLACQTLGLNNVRAVHRRAEEAAHEQAYRERFDIACARAVAAMPMLAELLLGFVKPKGRAVFWKGSGARDEVSAATAAIRQMGGTIEQINGYTLPTDEPEPVEFSLVICGKYKPTPVNYPRAFGIIKKKPLA